MDQQDTNTNNADAAWPELAADVTLAQGAARSITLDTQRATADGRILDITAQLDQMTSRLAAVESSLFEAAAPTAASDELLSRLAILGEELASTRAEFDALAGRVGAAEQGVATTMMVSVDGFDSRLAIVEDARSNQAQELNELTSYLEQAFMRIAELAEVIEVEREKNSSMRAESSVHANAANDSAQAQLSEVDLRVANLAGSLDELRDQVSSATATIDASHDDLTQALAETVAHLEDRVSTTEGRMAEFDDITTSIQFLNSRAEALDTLSAQVDHSNSMTQVELDAHRVAIDRVNEEAHSSHQLTQDVSDRIANMHETFDLVGQRIDLVETGTEALRGAADNALEGSKVALGRIDQLDETVDVISGKLENAATAIDAAHSRIDETESAAQSAHARIDEATQHLSEQLDSQLNEAAGRVDQRVTDVEQRLEHEVGEAHRRVDPLEGRLSESDERSNTIAAKLDQTIDCLEGVVGATADLAARVASAETTAGSVDEQVAAFSSSINETQHVVAQRIDDAISRLDDQEQHVASIDERIGDLSEHVTSNSEHLTATEHNVAEQTQHIISNEQSIANHDDRIAANEKALEDVDQRIESTVDARAEALREHLLSRVEEARAQLQLTVDESQAHVGESQADLRRSVLDRLEVIEHSIETRINEVEAVVNEAGISVRLTSVEAALDAADTTANEAYAFTESLRQLQTDIVQALQEELRSHEQLIGSTEERLIRLEQSGAEFASAERVQMLEAKLVEALQTISQLTQLQRRNTTVESQLTDTLAATSTGVETTQNAVAALREELDAAQQRIAHLERVLAATAAAAPIPAPTQSAPVPATPFVDSAPHTTAPQPMVAVEDDSDTGWFTESYARKNPESKAS